MARKRTRSSRNFDEARKRARSAADKAVGDELDHVVAGSDELERVFDSLKQQDPGDPQSVDRHRSGCHTSERVHRNAHRAPQSGRRGGNPAGGNRRGLDAGGSSQAAGEGWVAVVGWSRRVGVGRVVFWYLR